MASNINPALKKHLVVLEYTIDEGVNPKFLPWHDLLSGAVKLTNWRDITPELITEQSTAQAFGSFTSEHEFASVNDAMEALRKAAESDDSIPDEISPWQPFEDCSAKELLEHIESEITSRQRGYLELLQHEE
jgi:hypothetical protein